MSVETNTGVEEQDLQGNPQPIESEVEHNDVSEEHSQAEQQKRNDVEYNWAEMRRNRDRDKEELEKLRAEINSLKPKPVEEEEDFGINDDDLLEGRHLKDLKREIRQMKSELKKKEMSSMDERLALKYPDFNQTVSKENIDKLRETEPELVEGLIAISDPYKQAISTYKLVKQFAKNTSEQPSMEKRKALENSQKPLSVNAVTKQSAIGNAHMFENGLTPELKAQLRKEMEQAIKGA